MPKLPTDKLSKHATKGYRMTCGTYVGTDGKRRPKVFWLGYDEQKAMTEAKKIRWAAPIAAAQGGWTKDYEQQVRGLDTEEMVRRHFQNAERARLELAPHIPAPVIVQLPVAAATSVSPTSPAPLPAGTPMLHAALDAFVKAEKLRRISSHHMRTTSDSIRALKHYRDDCPLATIDFIWLETFTNELKARPRSRKKDSRTKRYEPIKPYTVVRLLRDSRRAFKWIGRQHQSTRFGGWRPPLDWQESFSVSRTELMTKVERDRSADGPEQFTLDELKKIYWAACKSRPRLHRILFLLGLFAGLGQTELSTVRRDEFALDEASFIHRRNKTGQLGRYWLPPELVTQLREHFKKHKVQADEPVFRNEGGALLVTANSDAVRQAWDDWRERSGVHRHGLGFYALRRFFGDYATRFGGEGTGQAALAHTAKDMRGKHYSGFRDFDKVKAAGQQLHAELSTLGMFDPLQDEKNDEVECSEAPVARRDSATAA